MSDKTETELMRAATQPERPDGGPAFPLLETAEYFAESTGMSLRDYFAAAALAHYEPYEGEPIDSETLIRVARTCFRIADAMLKAREEPR